MLLKLTCIVQLVAIINSYIDNMENRFVGFFDILGFKNLVEKNSHEKLVKIYKDVLIDTVAEIRRLGFDIHKNEENALKSLESIKQFIISDSIILIQDDCTHRGLFFITLQAKVLLQIAMDEGIPLRGAISVGPVTILEDFGTTIIGQGLINAYSLESTQNWSGAIIDDKCFQIHQNDNVFLEVLEAKTPLFATYKVPTKTQEDNNYHVINWVKDTQTLEEIDEAFLKHGKELILEKEKQLVINTIEFAKFSINQRETFYQINNARTFFIYLIKTFGVSIKTISQDSLEKLINTEENDIISFLLESPFYILEEKDNKSFIKHSMSNKLVDVDKLLSFKNIDSFETYIKLKTNDRIKVLKGLE